MHSPKVNFQESLTPNTPKGSDEEGSNNGAYQNIFIEYDLPKFMELISLLEHNRLSRVKERVKVSTKSFTQKLFMRTRSHRLIIA